MQEQQSVRRLHLGVIAGLSAVVLASGGGTAWWVWHSAQSPTPTPNPVTSPLPPSTQRVQNPVDKTAEVYWLKNQGNHIAVVPKSLDLPNSNNQKAVLEQAFATLLAGSTDPTVTTTIPEGTKLRSLEVRNDGVHINLSEEFIKGGGSASMTGRVAQILYSATSLNPDAQVWIDVEGEKLEVLGGEGLELDQPITRKSFEENFDL
ncbi:MAG TPA: GerMN domain-containing protein [Oculatellaceae cyanobacterium]|jgi:spore germination protein GerM